MKNTFGDLADYTCVLDLPHNILSEYRLMLERWEKCSGVPWTVSRCKEIYTDYIHYRAGEPLVGKWYKKNREGLPRGILSHIFKLSLRSKKKRFACGVLLRSYTKFVYPGAVPEQLAKFLKGVQSPDVVIPDNIKVGVLNGLSSFFKSPIRWEPLQASYLSFRPSSEKRVPLINGKTASELDSYASQWETVTRTKTGYTLMHRYSRIFSSVFSGFTWRIEGDIAPIHHNVDSVGKIGLIQESGLKLRAVANPNRVYQVALQPLGDAIYGTLKSLPWDCTFDQSKALPYIQEHLRNKKRCHCVDLTGATDYFPLSLQIDLLSSLFPSLLDYVGLFSDLSRAPWFFENTTISWTKGQPLGLYPSFGAFAMTHGFLLYYLNDFCHNNDFFVLGDDVIILNDSLFIRYSDALKKLECPVSMNKSISSVLLAEFGGKIITSDEVEPQMKWKSCSDDSFIDIIKKLGPRSLRLLRPQQRKVAKAIMDIPSDVGGCGFNPLGLPYSVRYEKYLSLFGEERGTFLMSYDSLFNTFFHQKSVSLSEDKTSNVNLSVFWDSSTLPGLDQRSASLVLEYLPMFLKWYGIMGTNLFSVVLNKDILPVDGYTGKRLTLLQVLQSKL